MPPPNPPRPPVGPAPSSKPDRRRRAIQSEVIRRRPGPRPTRPVRPCRWAATTAAHAPVPHALVSPAPRSQTRSLICWGVRTSAKPAFTRCGKSGSCSMRGPRLSIGTPLTSSTKKTTWGLPMLIAPGAAKAVDVIIHAIGGHRARQRDLLPAQERRAHVDGDDFIAGALRIEHPGCGLDAPRNRSTLLHQQPRHAARGVAAGVALAAIGVPNSHEGVAAHGPLKRDHLIAPDAASAVRDGARLGLRKRQRPTRARVKNDEVVAAAVHLEIAHRASM